MMSLTKVILWSVPNTVKTEDITRYIEEEFGKGVIKSIQSQSRSQDTPSSGEASPSNKYTVEFNSPDICFPLF